MFTTSISHRGRKNGETKDAPGNTRKAFEILLINYPDAEVETDVRQAQDCGFVGHYNLLEMWTNGSGFVNQLRREQLAALRVKCAGEVTDHGVLELDELFRLFSGRGKIHLELKYGPTDGAGLLATVLEVMARYPGQKVAISSFNHAALLEVPPYIPVGVLANCMPPNPVSYLKQFTIGGRDISLVSLNADIWNITDDALAAVQQAGVVVNAYTVPPAMFTWCWAHGVNPITDHMDAAIEFMAGRC